MKPIRCRTYLLASLVGVAVACQAPEAAEREGKTNAAGSSAPPAPLATAKPAEPARAAENTTVGASEKEAPVACAATDFSFPAVKAACADGGRGAAKKVMSAAIAKAKRAGTELKCSSCHVDQKTFGLRPNAVDDLAAWL